MEMEIHTGIGFPRKSHGNKSIELLMGIKIGMGMGMGIHGNGNTVPIPMGMGTVCCMCQKHTAFA